MKNVNLSTSYQKPVFNSGPTLIGNEFSHSPITNLRGNPRPSNGPSHQCSTIGSMEGKAAYHLKYRALLERKGNHYNNGLRRHWNEEHAHTQYILRTLGPTQRMNCESDARNLADASSNVKVEHAISPCDNLVPLNASTPSCVLGASSAMGQTEHSNISSNYQPVSCASNSLSLNGYLLSTGTNTFRKDTSYSSNVHSADSNKSFASQMSGDLPSNGSLASLLTNNSTQSFEIASNMHSAIPGPISISPHSLTSRNSTRSGVFDMNSVCSSPRSIPTNSSNAIASNTTDDSLDFDLPDDLQNLNDDLFNCVNNEALDLSISRLSDATDDLLNDLDPSLLASNDDNYANLFSP